MKTINIYGENKYEQSTKYREACCGIVLKEDKILLTYEVNTDQWFIPGGGLESGETIKECCARELAEETGHVVDVKEQFLTINEYYKLNFTMQSPLAIRIVSWRNFRRKCIFSEENAQHFSNRRYVLLGDYCMFEEIAFPEHEYESIQNYLKRLGYCYTTRVYKEVGKYKVGELYIAPWGDVLKIDEIKTYWKVSDRPFYEEMSDDEKIEIRKYSEDMGLPYEFIRFTKSTVRLYFNNDQFQNVV